MNLSLSIAESIGFDIEHYCMLTNQRFASLVENFPSLVVSKETSEYIDLTLRCLMITKSRNLFLSFLLFTLHKISFSINSDIIYKITSKLRE